MSLWTKAALGVATVAVCAGGAAAQYPAQPVAATPPVVAHPMPVHGVPVAGAPGMAGQLPAPPAGCSTCGGGKGGVLAGPVPNKIPHCNKHDGLTQYPLSEKRYIKQFCNPTICPNSCFGHFKTQWTAWPSACPGWPQEGVDPANYGPNFVRYAPPEGAAGQPTPTPAAPANAGTPTAPEPKAADSTTPPPAPPSKPAAQAVPKATTPDAPAVPMPTPPGGIELPKLPPAGNPGRF